MLDKKRQQMATTQPQSPSLPKGENIPNSHDFSESRIKYVIIILHSTNSTSATKYLQDTCTHTCMYTHTHTCMPIF